VVLLDCNVNVVVMDWNVNGCYDLQAIFRTYRYGQTRR
jgi:hypothetical protein